MKEVTKHMISDFKIKELGYDFMGYHLNKEDPITFHHLIVPSCKKGPIERWNGALLNGDTAHPYLHLIESVDYEVFCNITTEMIDMNIKGYLDLENIYHIHKLLCAFEQAHNEDEGKIGKNLQKEKYKRRVFT